MKKFVFIPILVLLLTACATKYQPYSFFSLLPGGYRETQLSADTFIVSFEGHEYSDRVTIYKYSLMRAAEVAKEHGFQYFIIISEQGFTKTSCSLSNYNTSTFLNVHSKPFVNVTIKAYKEQPSSTDIFFNVDELIAQIPC